MTDCYIGVQKCGCITFWTSDSDPAALSKTIARLIKDGLTVERAVTDEVRNNELFAPAECPHDPKGWERPPAPDPNAATIRWKRVAGRNVSRADVKHRYHGGYPAGEVRKVGRDWWATAGWFDPPRDATTANDGSGGGGKPAPVYGPFPSQKAAGAKLVELAVPLIVAGAQRAYDRMVEKGPEPHPGVVPTVTSTGAPVPDFQPGEVWEHRFSTPPYRRYRILQPARVHPWGGKGVCVFAVPLDREDHDENLLRTPWTSLDQSLFDRMHRVERAEARTERKAA